MQPTREHWSIRLQKRYNAYVEREDKALFERLKNHESLQPRWTASKTAAFAIAILIHTVTILLPIVGVALFVTQFAGCFSICYGILLLGVAIVVRPRFHKLPEQIVKAEDFPALYRYVDRIADELHAPHVDFIVINEYFNASYGRFGLRRSRVVALGHPLWMYLTPEERTALIAHEIAHSVNADFTRNFIVGSAIGSLAEWYQLVYPDHFTNLRTGGLFSVIVQFIMWVIANIILVWIVLLQHLLLLESRRAEYLADHLAASIGGTDATISLLRKLRERVYKTKPITTHPPTAYRIAVLEAKPRRQAIVEFSQEEIQKVDTEISRLDSAIAARIRQMRQQGQNYY